MLMKARPAAAARWGWRPRATTRADRVRGCATWACARVAPRRTEGPLFFAKTARNIEARHPALRPTPTVERSEAEHCD